MIPQKNRLNTKQFEDVFKKGTGLGSAIFFIKFQKNNLGYARVGVGVGKKLAAQPVQRNYYKRVLKSIAREILGDFSSPYDIILLANEKAAGKDFEALKKEANELIRKTKILNK